MSDPTVSPDAPSSSASAELDAERDAIVTSESVLLDTTLATLSKATRRVVMSYDQELLALRDQIAEARAEDLPPLVQQMERLQQIAIRRSEVPQGKIEVQSPYFGHLKLTENGRNRDVLIGNASYIDTERGLRIVDWRDAPVSRLYYRYSEGDEYEEEFGGRMLEGTVAVRRSVVISDAMLRRIMSPQGTFVRQGIGATTTWRRITTTLSRLAGGQGTAERAPALEEYSVRSGRLGVRVAGQDRHLPEIPALIDRRQFELISEPGSGLVVIQGGAGSGKTTIGLHRMAYLAFNDARRFTPDRMLVVVFNDALARYIGRVLPSLGVAGVQVITYTNWAARQRQRHVPHLPREYSEETPPVVTRLKKHPMMLEIIDERVADESVALGSTIEKAIRGTSAESLACAAWKSFERLTPLQRVSGMTQWLRGEREVEGQRGDKLPNDTRLALENALDRARERARDIVWDWAEMLTDRDAMRDAVVRLAPGSFTDEEIAQSVRYCSQRVAEMVINRHDEEDADDAKPREGREARESESTAGEREEALQELEPAERPRAHNESRSRRDGGDEDADDDLDEVNPYLAVDGVDEGQKVRALLDPEDDALLLRLFQRKRGPLRRDKKMALLFEHIFVDEAQDLSPVELAVLLDCATPAKSVTLAGDTAQRLLLDNGFTDWKGVLADLGLQSVNVEPLKIGYRSTAEVLTFAREVLGPLADPEPPIATRSGAPVEMHRFADTGAAVAFLGEALRDLALNEPRASVCVITREPERADLYFDGLRRSEVPRLSRVRFQDFSFKAGVEVTDIRQVKGLEFDYVVLVDATAGSYPVNDESRHLLHIGATRAAHQLWLVASGEPSRLLPDSMRV